MYHIIAELTKKQTRRSTNIAVVFFLVFLALGGTRRDQNGKMTAVMER